MLVHRYLILTGILLSLGSGACRNSSGKGQEGPEVPGTKAASIEAFSSQDELNAYMANLAAELQARNNRVVSNPEEVQADSASSAQGSSAPSNETITNNQEAGVDEGGIVKNIGDSMIVLRKGRLYAISTANSGLAETHAIDVAREPSLNQSVWYDELLVSGDKLYVVGYRYSTSVPNTIDLPALDGKSVCQRSYQGATEINAFRLADGKFERLGTSFIESYDYFSGQNYTSRMVGGKMVFYMPHSAFDTCGRSYGLKIPQYLDYSSAQGFTPVKPLFSAGDIFKNIESIASIPIFHSIVICELPDDGALACQAKAVLGDYSRMKYVSSEAVYLQTEDMIYSLGLQDSAMRAHAFTGQALDQFSFKETAGNLHVFVQNYASDLDRCTAALLSLPLTSFDNTGKQDLKPVLNPLPEAANCRVHKNRFVGNSLVFATTRADNGTDIVAVDLNQKSTKTIQVPSYVNRIEVLKDNLAFVSYLKPIDARNNTYSLEVGSLKLDQDELSLESLSLGETREGEYRSHGFFQKAEADGTHLMGLPVLGDAGSSPGWWGAGLSNIAFMRVDADSKIKLVGTVESGTDTGICQSSCVDWYGNTRPIFLANRIYALMGHEIQEVKAETEILENVGTRLKLSEPAP